MSPLLFLFCGNIAELNHVLAYVNTSSSVPLPLVGDFIFILWFNFPQGS